MIFYFADRSLTIIEQASTNLSDGLHIKDDSIKQAVELGENELTGYLCYASGKRLKAETAAEPGNYILCHSDGEDYVYTIIDTEDDTLDHEIYFTAESAGLDIIGGIAGPYTANGKILLQKYMAVWLAGTGFELGVDETAGATKAKSWDEYNTVTERIVSTAELFNCDASYRFEIEGMQIVHKYIDFRRKQTGTGTATFRRGRDFERLTIKKSAANIATSLIVTGGTPDKNGIYRSADDTYTWVKFSEYYNGKDGEGNASMSDEYAGMPYIGIATGKATEEESEDPDDYAWGINNTEGAMLVIAPSVSGHKQWKKVNGTDRYVWIMFATDETGSNMSDQPTDRSYVGYAINKSSSTKGTLPEDYTWIPMDPREAHRFIFIQPGSDAVAEGDGLYTWIRFSDSPTGANMDNVRAEKKYMGITAHRASATKSSNPADYIWKEITLNTTDGGFVRASGAYFGIRQSDGTYIWVKFAKDVAGRGMGSYPTADRPYIGIAYGKSHPNASFDRSDYEWYPFGSEESETVTLEGMNYDDGDFYITEDGRLNSRQALSRFSPNSPNDKTGHIIGKFESEATDQTLLLEESIAELTKRREIETTYEIELLTASAAISIGNTVKIVDNEGSLFMTARIAGLTKSSDMGTCKVTFSDFELISET